jgi:hypothetical protein
MRSHVITLVALLVAAAAGPSGEGGLLDRLATSCRVAVGRIDLGAHGHLGRSAPGPQGPWTQAPAPHDFAATTWIDRSAGKRRVFHLLTDADCRENEPASP